jgi:hypothetical protein
MIDISEICGSIGGREERFKPSRPCNIDRTQKKADDFQGAAVASLFASEEHGVTTKRRMLSENPSPMRALLSTDRSYSCPHLLKLSSIITYTASIKGLILSEDFTADSVVITHTSALLKSARSSQA